MSETVSTTFGRAMPFGATEALSAFCANLAFPALPQNVVDRAEDLILDHIGVSLFGSTLPWSSKVRAVAMADGARQASTIYGWGRTSVRNAALANGAAAHAIEFDDTHDEAMQHPGCVVIPAIMAVGEANDCSGRDLIAAMVGGYEVECRIGAAIGSELMQRGFHATAVCGVYGAAAAASMLMKLPAATISSAFGIGASMSSGVMQFSQDPSGNMIKRLHSGLPAERGVLAALLAAEGFTGPAGAIEGRYGLAAVFTGIADLSRTTRDLGAAFEIERITVKLYPCCKQFHALLEAIEGCRARRPFESSEVASIEAVGTRAMIETHMEYRPQSTMAAQYSLPYVTAAAIVLDPKVASSFEAPAIHREDVLRVADLVQPRHDQALEAFFPRKYPAGVRIRLRDGTELSETVLDARSSPDKPIAREDVRQKFVTVTSPLLSTSRQGRIIEIVGELHQGRSTGELAALLRGALRERSTAKLAGASGRRSATLSATSRA